HGVPFVGWYPLCTWYPKGTSTRLGGMTDTTPATAPADDRLRIAPEHRELLDQVLDKWSLHVLDELCERPLRFNELRRAIPVVTQKSLTTTLRRLERNGVVDRVVVRSRPGAVEGRSRWRGRATQYRTAAVSARGA